MANPAYASECARIEEDSNYSAETHHILAKRKLLWYKLFQLAPAIATAVIGTLTVGQVVPRWVGILGLVTAVITAISTVLNPQEGYYEHLSAAKAFTMMKHDARALRQLLETSPLDHTDSVKCLHERYNDLVRGVPMTEDWAFEKARKRIHAGVHARDETT